MAFIIIIIIIIVIIIIIIIIIFFLFSACQHEACKLRNYYVMEKL